jgi:hypothetical protein
MGPAVRKSVHDCPILIFEIPGLFWAIDYATTCWRFPSVGDRLYARQNPIQRATLVCFRYRLLSDDFAFTASGSGSLYC